MITRENWHARREEAEMEVNDEGVLALHKLSLSGVRNLIRPDTNRIARAFDELMTAVKVQQEYNRCHVSWAATNTSVRNTSSFAVESALTPRRLHLAMI